MLQESDVKDFLKACNDEIAPENSTPYDNDIDYERNDYSRAGIVIIPHTIDGESSLRFGQVNVNIHVPDMVIRKEDGKAVYRTDFENITKIREKVVEVLKNHYEHGKGYNWNIGAFNPPIKEQNHNEHYVSLALEITVREKSINQ